MCRFALTCSSHPPTRRPEAGSTTCTPTPQNLTVDQRIGGRTNHSPLTPLGERQAQALGAHLRAALAHAGVQPQRCAFFSSTAVRAVDTARLVMKELDVSGWGADNAAVSAGGHGTRPAVCAMPRWPPMVPFSSTATCLPNLRHLPAPPNPPVGPRRQADIQRAVAGAGPRGVGGCCAAGMLHP